MAGLQRSAVSFRRQGSSGLVWEDKLISEKLNNPPQTDGESSAAAADPEVNRGRNLPPIKTINGSRSNPDGGRGFRSKETAATPVEPPSPRVSACGLCSGFGKSGAGGKKQRATAAGKRRSR